MRKRTSARPLSCSTGSEQRKRFDGLAPALVTPSRERFCVTLAGTFPVRATSRSSARPDSLPRGVYWWAFDYAVRHASRPPGGHRLQSAAASPASWLARIGGLILVAAPDSRAPIALAAVLAVVGGVCGALGGAGVGAGLSVSEATARSRRALALVLGGAIGGGLVGLVTQWLARSSLAALVGVDVPIGGGIEGLFIGGAAGLGYAAATARSDGGLAAPRGRQRLRAIGLTSAACGLAAFAVTLADRPLVGGTIHRIAQASRGSQATLAPFGRLLGEPDFGPMSQVVIGTGEGALFGIGLALGLTRRP